VVRRDGRELRLPDLRRPARRRRCAVRLALPALSAGCCRACPRPCAGVLSPGDRAQLGWSAVTGGTREWRGSVFDPRNIRFFSILPEVDADEGFCVRHERPMQRIDPEIKHEGAVYTTADGWHVYSCSQCRAELGDEAVQAYRYHLMQAFKQWDDPDSDLLDGAFEYIGEVSDQ